MGFLAALKAKEAKEWLLPVILGALVGFGLIVGSIVLYEKGKSAQKAEQAQAIIKAQKKADELAEQLLIAQQEANKRLEATAQPFRERIASAPSTTACRDVPAIRAAIDGIRSLLSSAGNSPAK